MDKLIPTYYWKLDLWLKPLVWYRQDELPSWHVAFKKEWEHAASTAITHPVNEKYAMDPLCGVCTCPAFVQSRFLICKHVVQSYHPVHPFFFLSVLARAQMMPFWTHPLLQPLTAPALNPHEWMTQHALNLTLRALAEGNTSQLVKASQLSNNLCTQTPLAILAPVVEVADADNDLPAPEDNDDPPPDDNSSVGGRFVADESDLDFAARYVQPYSARSNALKRNLLYLVEIIRHNKKHLDSHFMTVFEQQCQSTVRLASDICNLERHVNSTRGGSNPKTWSDCRSANTMFVYTLPPLKDRET
jgi:hypothetical protein